MSDRKAAIDLYNAAVTAYNAQDNPERLKNCYQLFSSACVADPSYHLAWYQCGNNNSDMQMNHAAVACWRRALEVVQDPLEKAKILANIGWRLHCLGQEHEALETSNAAVEIDPNAVNAWLNLSLIHAMFDNPVQMVECARKSFSLAPTDATVEMALAFALLFDGQYQEGFRHFECRFRYKLKNFLDLPGTKWEGEPGKVVYLIADQGLGDTLSFARFVERASKRAKYVHAAVQRELLRLFTDAFIHLPNVNLLPQPCSTPAYDCWTTFVSLPSALGLTDAEVREQPHIKAPNYHTGINWRVPGRKLHIGIAWAGSPLNDIDKHRNIPLQQFLELYRVPGIQLYSLQVGPKNQELYDSGCLPLVIDLTRYIDNVTSTLDLLKGLDLVITCESALGHICALAGKECWIPYSFQGRDYRAGLTGDKKLWMPHHRYFRQGIDLDWTPVFNRIAGCLEERIDV